jgi:mycothiol system anti-sigma-R factor
MVDDAPQAGEPIEINSCDDVLSHVFEFLDHETDDARREVIAEHLEDCSSCLREFGIEQEFKALVRRRCGGDKPPTGLRERIKLQLTTVSFEEDGTQISVEKISTEILTGTDERPTAGAEMGRSPCTGSIALRRWGACRGWRRSSCGSAACVHAWTSLPSSRGAGGPISPSLFRAGQGPHGTCAASPDRPS